MHTERIDPIVPTSFILSCETIFFFIASTSTFISSNLPERSTSPRNRSDRLRFILKEVPADVKRISRFFLCDERARAAARWARSSRLFSKGSSVQPKTTTFRSISSITPSPSTTKLMLFASSNQYVCFKLSPYDTSPSPYICRTSS